MIDIHSHILPGIDDGAGNVEESRAMLTLQLASGADRLFLTPHYHPEEIPLDVFLAEREKAWTELKAELDENRTLQARLGAEVRYCPELLSLDLRKVTLGSSDYLLLELPGRRYLAYTEQMMEELLGRGIVPILAHVERCTYFREKPELLKRLVELGVLAQVSAKALFDKRDKRFAISCLEHNLAQMIASDSHNTTDRRPCMELLNRLPEELRQLHETFSGAVWDNELPPYIRPSIVKKTIFGYR